MIRVLESDGEMILTGENRRTRRKTYPSAALSTTNPTWIDPVTNPGLRGERPATNDLSHSTTHQSVTSQNINFTVGDEADDILSIFSVRPSLHLSSGHPRL
jgi:hypothetical protein